MTTVRLLVNPAAGAGTAGMHADQIAELLRSDAFDVEATTTRSPEHAVDVAAAADENDIVAPLGGDGMLSLATRGLLKSGARMLPLPAGRGNDFVRALGIPLDTAAVAGGLREACQDIEAYTRHIDVGVAGGTPFLGVLSIGFDAQTNARANKLTRMRGPLVYTAAGAQTFFTNHRNSYIITDGQETHTVDAWNIAVGNSGRHGGGQRVCPDASLTDGRLDVVSFGGGRAQFAAAALSMRLGRHVQLPSVMTSSTREITIDVIKDASGDGTSQPLVAYADGDEVGTLPLTVTVLPGALRIIVPRFGS